ncbi:MAG: capsular polysaccharide synthesis protein [Rikenellaceae bacterium]
MEPISKKEIIKTVRLRIVGLYTISRVYSLSFAFWSAVWWLCFYLRMPISYRLSRYAIERKTKWLDRYIERNYSEIINRHINEPPQLRRVEEPKIWIFWGQGEDNMPPLIRACYRQLTHLNGNSVLLTNDNLHNYVELPPIIYEKVHDGMVSWANYSDIIRNRLLSRYGGLWLDATVWVSQRVPLEKLNETPIYTAHGAVSRSRCSTFFWTSGELNWSSWCLWSREAGYPLFSFVGDMLCAIASKERVLPDYVTQDYLIDYLLAHLPSVKHDMKRMTLSNDGRLELANMMNEPFDNKRYCEVAQREFVFKLSFRRAWHKQTATGKQTLYGRMLEGVIE